MFINGITETFGVEPKQRKRASFRLSLSSVRLFHLFSWFWGFVLNAAKRLFIPE